MKIKQLYTGCLAEAAYYIESDGVAAIIDPLRDISVYLESAKADNAIIRYVFETHFHADFVSGHIELNRKTGAEIIFGPHAKPVYQATIARDGQSFSIGKVTLIVLHTPGHTLESSCFLLRDESGKDYALFTGDTLFLGDVGRPDLVEKVNSSISPEYLAGQLYDSLQSKLKNLPDDLILYPGHGAGSACGKKLSKETVSTLGQQRLVNYALDKDLTRDTFIQSILTGLTEPPRYFPSNVHLNITGEAESLDTVILRGMNWLDAETFRSKSAHALVLDTRLKEQFVAGFIPESLWIGLDDSFAPWAGALIDNLNQPILIIAEPGREEEVITRLARVGFDGVIGILKDGFETWKKAGYEQNEICNLKADAFSILFERNPNLKVLDVRRQGEYLQEHLEGSINLPLNTIANHYQLLDKTKEYYIHCAGGYRSIIYISYLMRKGFRQLINIEGGYAALAKTSLRRTEVQEVLSDL